MCSFVVWHSLPLPGAPYPSPRRRVLPPWRHHLAGDLARPREPRLHILDRAIPGPDGSGHGLRVEASLGRVRVIVIDCVRGFLATMVVVVREMVRFYWQDQSDAWAGEWRDDVIDGLKRAAQCGEVGMLLQTNEQDCSFF